MVAYARAENGGAVRLLLSLIVAVGLALLVGGCGDAPSTDDPPASAGSPGSSPGGSVPVTPQALALVAGEYAGTPDSAQQESDAAGEFSAGGVGAELRFGSTGEHDGDLLVVAVGTGLPRGLLECRGEAVPEHCVVTDRGVLAWEEEMPEEDPGVVYVIVAKDEAAPGGPGVMLFQAGDAVTADPRELDLTVSVDSMFDIAHDPRVDVTTSEETVDAAQALPFWVD